MDDTPIEIIGIFDYNFVKSLSLVLSEGQLKVGEISFHANNFGLAQNSQTYVQGYCTLKIIGHYRVMVMGMD